MNDVLYYSQRVIVTATGEAGEVRDVNVGRNGSYIYGVYDWNESGKLTWYKRAELTKVAAPVKETK